MFNFIKCPFCAGHETVSAEAAERIAGMIYNSMHGWPEDHPLMVELSNIHNAILNQAERTVSRYLIVEPGEHMTATEANIKGVDPLLT